MKTVNVFGVIVLMSFLLAISGCGSDDPQEPAEDVVVEDIDSPDMGVVEPQLPDDAVQDVGSDITATGVKDTPAAVEEESPDVVEDTGAASDEESADTGDEAKTAQNYRVVSLKDLKAYPEEMTIKPGTTVEWRNVNDKLQHIIGWSGQRQMGVTPEPILAGESWSYTFEKPGKIVWFSTARPTVQGTIIIEEE
ncbi:MAG: hypothetical protein V1729_06135 [Candidatus Woesearchaeota archaeon]